MSGSRIGILILAISLVVNSCSVGRRTTNTYIGDDSNISSENIITVSQEGNISAYDFIVSRMKIDYRSEGDKRSLNGFLKHNRKGEMLLSIRSVAGIEVARVYFSRDSLKIYDKVNYILYIQDNKYLEKKYALPYEALGLLWGDYPKTLEGDTLVEENELYFTTACLRGDIKYLMEISKNSGRIQKAEIYHSDGRAVQIKHMDFNSEGELLFPTETIIEDGNGRFSLGIKYAGVKREKVKSMRFSTLNKKEIRILR